MSYPLNAVDANNALRHYAVTGPSGGELRTFYEYFGFVQLVTEEVPASSYIQALTGGKWSSAHILKVRNAAGDILEIIEPSGPTLAARTSAEASWTHVAFTVTNCDSAVQEVVAMGGTVVGGPIANPDAPFRVAYVRDPSGNLIEIVEHLE